MHKSESEMKSSAPKAIGPYSQTRKIDNLIFCSGQIGIDPTTENLTQGVEEQVKQTLKNLEAVLQEVGANLSHVVKTTVYLKNMDDFSRMNEIYASFFGENKPARATVQVAALPKSALVEIEAIAALPALV